MKRVHVLSSALAFLLLAGCSAGTERPDARSHVDQLTSPEFQGRVVGSTGNDAAADYIAEQFAALQLEPWGEDYFVPYEDELKKDTSEDAAVVIQAADGSKTTLTEGVDFTCSPCWQELQTTISLSSDPDSCGTETGYLGNDASSGSAFLQESPSHIWVECTNAFSGTTALLRMGKQAGIRLTISEEFQTLLEADGTTLILSLPQTAEVGITNNVVAKKPGSSGQSALLICAHFDGSGSSGELVFPSAWDNASGTAAMLRIAALVADQQSTVLENDVLFAALNGEESGMTGSEAFASELADRYESVSVINLDCVGLNTSSEFVVASSEHDSTLQEALLALDLGKPSSSSENSSSDHKNFSQHANMTAVAICDDTMVDAQTLLQTAVHGPSDTSDSLAFDVIETVAEALADFIFTQGDSRFSKQAPQQANGEEDEPDPLAVLRDKLIAEGLDYNEIYCCEAPDSGVPYLLSGLTVFSSPEELTRYYPDLHPAESIGDYTFVQASVCTESMFNLMPASLFSEQYEPGTVAQVDWTQDPLTSISLAYESSGGIQVVLTYHMDLQADYSADPWVEVGALIPELSESGYYVYTYTDVSEYRWCVRNFPSFSLDITFGGWKVDAFILSAAEPQLVNVQTLDDFLVALDDPSYIFAS